MVKLLHKHAALTRRYVLQRFRYLTKFFGIVSQ